MSKRILIVGAGIGGLTSALCLLAAGFEVRVIERAKTLTPIGAGLQCGANALHVLNNLGVTERLAEHAVAPLRAEFKDFKTGRVLAELPLGADYEARFGAPYWHVHRGDLQQVLLDALLKRAPEALLLGASINKINHFGERVEVELASGEQLVGAALIGADGVHSQIRAEVFNAPPPRYAGQYAWRALVPTHRLPEGWMEQVVTNFVGPRQHAVLYYVRGGEFANLVGVVERRQWSAPVDSQTPFAQSASWQQIKDDFAGWHPMVQHIIDAAQAETCFRWPLMDQPRLNRWHANRVALLGDSAHATLPFMAAGAAMAIEDACILARCLAGAASIEQGLAQYAAHRQPRTAKVQRMSRGVGRLYHVQNAMFRRVSFAGFRLALSQQDDFLPGYNANTVSLPCVATSASTSNSA